MIEHPLFVQIAGVTVNAILITGAVLYNKRSITKANGQKAIHNSLSQKVDSKACIEFQTKIAAESAKNGKNVEKIFRTLIYLVVKAGGKPKDLGLDK